MDFPALAGDGRAMSPSAVKLDRSDLRRQRRSMTPTFEVIVECELYRSVDWSAGGVHLDGVCEGLDIGTRVEGWIALPGAREAFAFSGRVLRTDDATGNTVVGFDDMDDETAAFLDRCFAWRLH